MTKRIISLASRSIIIATASLCLIYDITITGVGAAMHEIMTIYGPSRDSIYTLLDEVLHLSKQISLHVKNLILHGHLFPHLDDLVHKAIEDAEIVIETLPRYYTMVTNVSYTMESIGWELHKLTFMPTNLGKATDECYAEMNNFVNKTVELEHLLTDVKHDLELYAEGHRELNLKETLRKMYKRIMNFEDCYVHFKNSCLEQFIESIDKLHEFNDTYHVRLMEMKDVEFMFDYDEESNLMQIDLDVLKGFTEKYIEHATEKKQRIQQMLEEARVNKMRGHVEQLSDKIKARLIEDMRHHMNEAIHQFKNWYIEIQHMAVEFDEYTSYHYMEERSREMHLWQAPIGNFEDSRNPPLHFSNTNLTSSWTTADFLHGKSISTTETIIEDFFKPLNGVLNDSGNEISEAEEELDTTLQEVSRWMAELRNQEKIDESFVL